MCSAITSASIGNPTSAHCYHKRTALSKALGSSAQPTPGDVGSDDRRLKSILAEEDQPGRSEKPSNSHLRGQDPEKPRCDVNSEMKICTVRSCSVRGTELSDAWGIELCHKCIAVLNFAKVSGTHLLLVRHENPMLDPTGQTVFCHSLHIVPFSHSKLESEHCFAF